MKKDDLIFLTATLLLFSPFVACKQVYNGYTTFNAVHPYMTAFLKFGILATAGEAIGLRIKTGSYNEKGFGLLPRAIVWGMLGMWIAAVMKILSSGVPIFAETLGFRGITESMRGGVSPLKVLGAFLISVTMNTTFAPVFMTLHKITDTHILNNGGSMRVFLQPVPVGRIISSLDWKVQWNFVFKRTIPLFWIPAHTITFLLPPQYQTLSAALLGVMLGILLSVAAVMGRADRQKK